MFPGRPKPRDPTTLRAEMLTWSSTFPSPVNNPDDVCPLQGPTESLDAQWGGL